jgi:thiamine biosynthesis lipoprotein
MKLTRRTILQLTAALPAASQPLPAVTGTDGPAEYRFHLDHVMGTSLDLVIFARSDHDAYAAESAALDEITRLCGILSTYSPASEVSISGLGSARSPELAAVAALYEDWSKRTSGGLSCHINGKLNLDALGKPFIAAKALEAARAAAPGVTGMLVDAGGDIVVSGRNGSAGAWPIGVSDPAMPYYNARPVTILKVASGAVATSGTTARGAHLIDPRTGRAATSVLSASVIAPDAVTANALSTAVCILGEDAGLKLVERTYGAECMMIAASGRQIRSSGFSRFEKPVMIPVLAAANWPQGFEVLIDLTLKDAGPRRPYIAVWIEDTSKHFIRNLVVCYRKPRYLNDLRAWFDINANRQTWNTVSRPTPAPGHYTLHWDGLDENRKPVAQGTYKVIIETAREHSYYTKEFAQIVCEEEPASASSRKSPEYDPMQVTYGPRKQAI